MIIGDPRENRKSNKISGRNCAQDIHRCPGGHQDHYQVLWARGGGEAKTPVKKQNEGATTADNKNEQGQFLNLVNTNQSHPPTPRRGGNGCLINHFVRMCTQYKT